MQQTTKDIISKPIELTDAISDTKFRLVHMAAQRVRQLSSGEPILVPSRSIKDTTIAIEEALAGQFRVIVGEEAERAKEEYKKREEKARLEEQLSAKEEEIRKELTAYLSETQSEEGAEEELSEAAEEPSAEDLGESEPDENEESEPEERED